MIPYQLAEQKNDPILRARLAKRAYSAIAQRLNKLDPKSHGYDHWVLEEELGKYFDEVNLEIQWLD